MRLRPEAEAVLQRLRTDFPYFASVALRIQAKDGSIQPLRLNTAQQHIHRMIEEQRKKAGMVRAIILKGRQQGVSTYVEGRYYWRVSMGRGLSAYILTHEDRATRNIFGMARRYHQHMPDPLRPETSASSATELAFATRQGRYLVGTAGTRGTGRSSTVQLFHGSEVAFWPSAEEHMAGVAQAVPDLDGTEVILESTANGVGNLFHSMWVDAERGRSQYIPIFVPWYWQTEYRRPVPEDFSLDPEEEAYRARHGLSLEQMAWRRIKITDDFRGDSALFDQEYPATPALAFRRAAAGSYIGLDLVDRAQQTALAVDPTAPLVMGVDPAEYGDDDTAIALRRGRVVLEVVREHGLGPMQVVGRVAILADRLRPDAIAVDATGIGSGVADRLIELGYPAHRILFGAAAEERDRFANVRSELWGRVKDWLEDVPCRLPMDAALAIDLCGPRYSYDSSRRLALERKEDMRKRGLASPDSADALALTFAVHLATYRPRLRSRPSRGPGMVAADPVAGY